MSALALASLAPASALAQDAVEEVETPPPVVLEYAGGPSPVAWDAFEPPMQSRPQSDRRRDRRGLRILLEGLTGYGMGIAGAGAGGLIGGGIGIGIERATADGEPDPLTGFLIGLGVGGGVGYVTMMPLGVYIMGTRGGGNGSLPFTYMGGLIGTAVGAALAPLMVEASVVTALIASIGGAILGYELSCDEQRLAPAARTNLLPTVHASADGATAGVAGTF